MVFLYDFEFILNGYGVRAGWCMMFNALILFCGALKYVWLMLCFKCLFGGKICKILPLKMKG